VLFQEQFLYVGLRQQEFGIEAGTLFLIQFFGSTFWAIGWFCMTIMRRQVSLCCLQAKKDKGTALQIILYSLVDLLHFLPFLVTRAFIYASSSSCFFVGLWMLLRCKIV
jgi:protoheme IX farnesyltransferase